MKEEPVGQPITPHLLVNALSILSILFILSKNLSFGFLA